MAPTEPSPITQPTAPSWPWTLCYLLLPLPLAGAIHLSLRGIDPDEAPPTGSPFVDWLASIPLSSGFYFLLAALLGVYLSRRQWLYRKFCDTFDVGKQAETGPLSPHDWWVVRELRERAFWLRGRADMTLCGIVVFLLGSLYTFTFLVAFLAVIDRTAFESAAAVREFSRRFDRRLDAARQGLYWFQTTDVFFGSGITLFPTSPSLEVFGNQRDVAVAVGERVHTTTDGGLTWQPLEGLVLDRDPTVVALSMQHPYGVLGDTNGRVYVTVDGRTWNAPDAVRLVDETARAAAFGDNGPRTILGSRGSVFISDDGTSWRIGASLDLPSSTTDEETPPRMWRTEFAEDGLRGVVITERSVHVTVDGGRTWTQPELLNRRDVSVIGHGVAFGDEGSFMVRTVIDIKLPPAPSRGPFSAAPRGRHTAR